MIWLSAPEKFLSYHPTISFLSTSFIFSLTHNFSINSHDYLEVKGTAMGTMIAPSYRNLFMGNLEDFLLKSEEPDFWLRFFRYLCVYEFMAMTPFSFFLKTSIIATFFEFTWIISPFHCHLLWTCWQSQFPHFILHQTYQSPVIPPLLQLHTIFSSYPWLCICNQLYSLTFNLTFDFLTLDYSLPLFPLLQCHILCIPPL